MSAFYGHLRIFLAMLVACAGSAALHAQDDAASRRTVIDKMMYPVMIAALEAKNFGRARNICDQAIIWEPQNPLHHYNLACIEAQAGGSRLPYALGALDLAIALGFDDVDHLKTDPDLQPLHGDPKFAELVRKATFNATVGAVGDTPTLPGSRLTPAPGEGPALEAEKPAAATFLQGVPVGLYFMTRYRVSTRTLENAVWYFAPDGQVYQNLTQGFSNEDLASHPGPQGTAAVHDAALVVSWADGQKTSADLERDGTGFLWDMGIFSAATSFEDLGEVAGIYEGGETLSSDGNRAVLPKRLELRADGTYAWTGVSFGSAASQTTTFLTGDREASKGRWQIKGYSLILTEENGAVLRRMAFPDDDEKTVVKPDRLFFAGVVYKRQL